MDKKYIIIGVGVLLVIVLVILLLVSGGNKTNKTATNKLVVWDSLNMESDLSDVIKDFTDSNPKIEVEFVKKNPASYETDSVNAIASGKGPDVWIVPSNWIPKQLSKLSTMPEKTLDSKGKKSNAQTFKDVFVDAAYTDNVINDQVYGLPLYMDTLSLYYNSTLLENSYQAYAEAHPQSDLKTMQQLLANPPANWSDLSTQIKYFGANTIALGTQDIENASDILTLLLLQYGAQMTSEDKSAALFHTSTNLIGDSAYPGAQALNFYTSFAKKGDPNFTWDGSLGSAYNAFVGGKVSMMIGYGKIYNQLTDDLGRRPNVAALPQIAKTGQKVDLANYEVMTVPKSSEQNALAWNFINFVVSGSSSLNIYLSNRHLTSPLKANNQSLDVYSQAQAQEAQTWYNPDPTKVDNIFKNAINQVLSGQNSQTVVEGAAAQVTTLLSALKGNQ